MIYTNDRQAYREFFYTIWQKYLQRGPLETVESDLIQIMLNHPEYQHYFEKSKQLPTDEFSLEDNPFIHLSLHHALNEQIKCNRPNGIKNVYTTLLQKFVDPHDVAHRMMQCLAQELWQAQASGTMPSEEAYLQKLKGL